MGIANIPRYLGANSNTNKLSYWADIEYPTERLGRFQLNAGSLTMDPSINWDPWVEGLNSVGLMIGYHGNSSLGESHSTAMDVDSSGLDMGIQWVASVNGIPLIMQARKSFDSTQGWLFVCGSYLPVKPTRWLTVFLLPSISFADQSQYQAGFGVSKNQSKQYGLQEFSPHPGAQDASVEMGCDIALSAHWHMVASGAYVQLLGSAQNSPLTKVEKQIKYTFGTTYHF
jgi:outer membrane scaffolding protein for murein synthesis (MipA/OmpV family)